jgi:hypothetical protein
MFSYVPAMGNFVPLTGFRFLVQTLYNIFVTEVNSLCL